MNWLIWTRKHRTWVLLGAAALLIKLVSLFPALVETWYTRGFYILVSKALRFLFGWIPFSIGDILYAVLIFFLIYRGLRGLAWLFRGRKKDVGWSAGFRKLGLALLLLYVIFYAAWGLNYSRQGIAVQFGLPDKKPTTQDLDTLVWLLHNRINHDVTLLRVQDRDSLANQAYLFNQAEQAYQLTRKKYPFLDSRPVSVKASLFGRLMNYTGVQGYYNPFSGEAQVNTTIPSFLLPSVVTHEIGHQAGYGMESEANFLSFLASRQHPSIHFQYATDFVMYAYAQSMLYMADSLKMKQYDSTLHPQVQRDMAEYRAFYEKYQGRVETMISWLYANYLKINNQPAGKYAYDEVVIWLIGWYKKYGKTAI
ncbi:DUF3810 domain-containing protein [Niabella sp. CC-SYL272]|uniref:DUF3810 domain-containing protein n=1 Tax=Niabella agricola TaxID=2891571 RepID=UPI001F32D34A|nr:DUF3810 domain-containing protein [Niabella agricola]MCF3111889.1 DUF3810 domain-containing protein [Niabella agricola]